MTNATTAGSARAGSAIGQPRQAPQVQFKLLPVPTNAIPGWAERVAQWAAS